MLIMICALYTPNVFVYIHITVIIVMIWLMYNEIVKTPAPIFRSLNLMFFGCQLDEPYGFPGVTTSRMQQCFNILIDSYHKFLLLFYCCVLLEIKLTNTTTTTERFCWQSVDGEHGYEKAQGFLMRQLSCSTWIYTLGTSWQTGFLSCGFVIDLSQNGKYLHVLKSGANHILWNLSRKVWGQLIKKFKKKSSV